MKRNVKKVPYRHRFILYNRPTVGLSIARGSIKFVDPKERIL